MLHHTIHGEDAAAIGGVVTGIACVVSYIKNEISRLLGGGDLGSGVIRQIRDVLGAEEGRKRGCGYQGDRDGIRHGILQSVAQ